MLKTIIKKEVQNNIFSFRFLTSLALLLIVVPIMTFILTSDYLKKVDEYSQRQTEIEDYLRHYAHFNRVGGILAPSQPPIPFYSLIQGLSSETNLGQFDNDPLPVMFPLIDLAFIVTILISLIALVFSYDAVCGEKEDGTLKLMLANKFSRSSVILGKILGGILTLFIPFVLSLVFGLLIIVLHPRIAWTWADWGALGLIVLGAVLYFCFFYVLGVFISSCHHSSSSSIMTSLFVWVLLVLLIPNLSPYVASFLSPTPSRVKVERETAQLSDTDRDDLGRKLMRARLQILMKCYPILALAQNLSAAELKERVAKDPDLREAVAAQTKEVQAAWDEANRIQGDKINALWNEQSRRERAQTRISIYLSMISPLADFAYLATDLSSTGMQNSLHFARLREAWDRSFADYMRGRIAALQKKDPSTDWWNTAIDMSDRPKFEYKEEPLAARIKATLPNFTVLVGFVITIFGAAYAAFVRYDVR